MSEHLEVTAASSTKVLNVIILLENALSSKDGWFDVEGRLTKTLRVARNALLHIYHGVEQEEIGSAFEKGWETFEKECQSDSRIGGRLWDVAELLRLHHGYESPRPVAQATIYALAQLADELRSKEEDMEREAN
jgi:hypothetical protein